MNDTHQDTAYEEFIARRRRTKPCKYFQTGACWNTAEECKWAHVYYRTSGDPWQRPCKYYLEGFCARGQHCEFLHGNDPSRCLTPPERQVNLRPPPRSGYPLVYPVTIPFKHLDYHHDSDNSYPSDSCPPSEPETTTTDDVFIECGSHFDSDTDRILPTSIQVISAKSAPKKRDSNRRPKRYTAKNPRVAEGNKKTEDSVAQQRPRRRSKTPNWRVISGGVLVGNANGRNREATADLQTKTIPKTPIPRVPQHKAVPVLVLPIRCAKPVDLQVLVPPVRPTSAPPTATTPYRKPGTALSVFAAEA